MQLDEEKKLKLQRKDLSFPWPLSVGSTGWGGEQEPSRVTRADCWFRFLLCRSGDSGLCLLEVGMGDVWEEGRLQHALVSSFWVVLCPKKGHWEAVVI